MSDDLSPKPESRHRSGRRRTAPTKQGSPVALLALMAVALVGVVGAMQYLSVAKRTETEIACPVDLSAPAEKAEPQEPWVDLAKADGPLPSPPEDPTANMILIPAGKFLYGEENEEMELPAFFIDRCEVSQAEYAAFLRYVRETGDHSHCNPDEPRDKDHTPLNWGRPDITDPRYPVVGIDYWDVVAYAGWVGKRLPTEQEWEKAARGTDGRLYTWGDEWDEKLCNWGPTKANPRTLLPVDSMPEGKSPFGCLHMLGNAAEWTASYMDDSQRLRCGRGYCWRIGHMIPYRTTYRMPGPTNLRDEGSGIRCALDVPSEIAD